MPAYATLGVVPATTESRIDFDDWAIDGVPLRTRAARSSDNPLGERTFMSSRADDRPWAIQSLRALIGEDSSGDPWVRFSDRRVGILFCELCGDMNCATLSAEIVADSGSVTWRDIAFQVGYEPFDRDGQLPLTISFERAQYEGLIRSLLGRP